MQPPVLIVVACAACVTASVMTEIAAAAPIRAMGRNAEIVLAQLKVNTALSLERVPIAFNRAAL